MSFVRYIRRHPFSIVALTSIVGDLGYLGFAFAAHGWVSLPKLAGALFTIGAHVILLAYGDDKVRHIVSEQGMAGRIVLALRTGAKNVVGVFPQKLRHFIRVKPVGVPFTMLCMNGVGLIVDAMMLPVSIASVTQTVVGIFIVLGCGAFAMADFVSRQGLTNFLLKIGPPMLTSATLSSGVLVLTTRNVFLAVSFFVFLLGNFAAFFTRIDKKQPVSAGI